MPESFFVLSKEHLQIATDEIITILKLLTDFQKLKLFLI